MGKSKVVKSAIALVIVLICIALFVVLIIYNSNSLDQELDFSYELFDNKNKITETINSYSSDKYSLEIQKLKEKINRMQIFPETISDTAECKGFSYIEEVRIIDWGLDYRAEVFFSIKYSEDSYIDETVRLSSIKNDHKNKEIIFSQNLFNYPAYVSIYNEHSRYEYALLNEDNHEIIYIYLFDCGEDNICFSNDYIPFKRIKDSDFPKKIASKGYYTIYY